MDHCVLGTAEARGIGRDRIEDWFHVGRGSRNGTQDLGEGRLSIERLPCLVEETSVVHRDDRLVGESLDEVDLVGGERPNLLVAQHDHPDRLAPTKHRHGEVRAEPRPHGDLVVRIVGVGEGIGDRGQLVLGLGIGEAGGKLLVDPLLRMEHVARPQLALGGDADQLAGDVADALLDARFARLPGDPAEPVELHPGILGAEAGQDFDVLDRDEQFVVAGVEHAQAVMRRPRGIDRFQRLVAADPVIGVDDKITRRQVVHLGDKLIQVAPPPRGPRQPVAEDVLLAEQHELLGRKALLDGQYREPDSLRGERPHRMAVGNAAQVGDAALAQHGQEALGGALAEGGDCRPPAGFALGREVVAHRLEERDVRIGALDREIARRAGAGIEPLAVALRRGEGREPDDRPAALSRLPFEVV